ncbi:MAG: hemerythrin domain-containing protein [Myxococcales bacterium]|nr:hemerythrin domain-containing protein [Myxococcales bacterium]
MSDPDLLSQLEHDHGPLTEWVETLRQHISDLRGEPSPASVRALHPAFSEAVEELRDDLLEHFGREEECLFPFLCDTLPELRARIEALEAGHDQICGALLRLGYLADREVDEFIEQLDQVINTFGRFDDAYIQHAADERDLLHRANAGLNPAQRAALREAERGLL